MLQHRFLQGNTGMDLRGLDLIREIQISNVLRT